MKIYSTFNILFFILLINTTFAQDDLLKELDTVSTNKKEIEIATFKGMQICTMQSTKMAAKNEWYFVVSHRFGDLTNGLDNFFGLDNAYTKLGGLYGVTNCLTIGFSRHTFNKTFEGTAKYKLLSQEVDGFPFTIVGFHSIDINTALSKDQFPGLTGTNRLAFSSQLPISRKFSDSFSLELNPIWVHKNLYNRSSEKRDQFLMAIGGRYKIAKRMSLNIEYASRISQPKEAVFQNPLTLGLDIETGGHVFQMVFSNSQALNDVSYFTNASGKWNDKGIFFGFNMYRVF
jgi:Membrane bound beta barrel domain (DUF5777)